MPTVAAAIELGLTEKLKDKTYRRVFFLAEASARIAAQLIALRKRRGLNQKQVAELTETRQPAISRVEQADYQNWSFNTLRAIAGALDARIRVIIEPAEDVLSEYENEGKEVIDQMAGSAIADSNLDAWVPYRYLSSGNHLSIHSYAGSGLCMMSAMTLGSSIQPRISPEMAKLRDENGRLKMALLKAPTEQSRPDSINPMVAVFGANQTKQALPV